jgi:hypothetical protein
VLRIEGLGRTWGEQLIAGLTKQREPSVNAAPSESLAGTVERVTFHNADSGFAVFKVKTRGNGT